MRTVQLALLAGLVLLATGCGAGGIESYVRDQVEDEVDAYVSGKVVTRDGSTTDLAGVQVAYLDGDAAAETDADGSFRLRVRARERVRIRFHDPDHLGERNREVDVDPLDKDEECEIDVELKDGEVVESWVGREREQEHMGGALLVLPDDPKYPDAVGEIQIVCDDACCALELEVGGCVGAGVLEIVFWHPAGGEYVLGEMAIDEAGAGRFVIEACAEDTAEKSSALQEVGDLAGVKLLLVDAAGDIALLGLLPAKGPQHDDKDRGLGDGRLLPPEEGASEPTAKGWVLIKGFEDCHVLAIEVRCFATTPLLDIVVENAEGVSASLGQIQVDERGLGWFVEEACAGDTLPFGVESLAGLSGLRLTLVDAATEAIVLAGRVPEIGRRHDDKGDEGDEGGKEGT